MLNDRGNCGWLWCKSTSHPGRLRHRKWILIRSQQAVLGARSAFKLSKSSRSTLISLACASRHFTEPCLDILWRSLESFKPLLDLLPASLVDQEAEEDPIRVNGYLPSQNPHLNELAVSAATHRVVEAWQSWLSKMSISAAGQGQRWWLESRWGLSKS